MGGGGWRAGGQSLAKVKENIALHCANRICDAVARFVEDCCKWIKQKATTTTVAKAYNKRPQQQAATGRL